MAKINYETFYADLAQPRLGAAVISSSDDFFAEHENLIKPEAPVFIPGKFTDRGKWMDGWESRRKRIAGYDHCIVRICRGVVHGINIDTTHFTGNYPQAASVEACDCSGEPNESTQWHELIPKTDLDGNSHNMLDVDSLQAWTHLRLNIYPDGGVARLRVYGEVFKDWSQVSEEEILDLAAMENGGVAMACSDMHFGHVQNLTAPGRAVNMGDSWETARRRGPGFDWAVIKLGKPGHVKRISADTLHFKGNFPAHCIVRGVYAPGADVDYLSDPNTAWKVILPEAKMQANHQHEFDDTIEDVGPVSHVKLEIYPDGGVGRLRIWGTQSSRTYPTLTAEELTPEAFKPYGEVIDTEGLTSRTINTGFAERYENFTRLDVTEGGHPAISIFEAHPVPLPFQVQGMERHPVSSQIFMPAGNSRFLVLVADTTDIPKWKDLRLFITNGNQGVNYRRGTWHHFLLTLDEEQKYYVVDRSNPDENTEECELQPPVWISKKSIAKKKVAPVLDD